MKLALPVAMLSAALVADAGAVQNPPGCNANTLNLTLSRSTGTAVPGQMVTFGVSVAVPVDDGSGNLACDTTDVDIYAQCPDLNNPPQTAPQLLVSGASYAAGTPLTPVGQIICPMPDPPTTQAVVARSTAEGTLLDTDALPGSPFNRENTITVTVTPCQVEVDKQVSCDGGTTWVDPGLVLNNEDGTLDCAVVGLSGPVMVRYQASNTGSCLLTECVLSETNATFGTPPAVGTLPPGQTTDFLPAQNSPACSDAFGDPQNPNEPNTASITCQTGGTPVTASDLAAFTCLRVDATVDRAVNCGDGFTDQTLVRANDDGTNGCTAVNGEPVNWQYDACNEGTAPLYDCVLVDENLTVSDPILVGNLAAGACAENLPATNNPVLCSDNLEASEAPDQGRVNLTCCTQNVDGIANCNEAHRVVVYDVSTVTCTTPSGLNLVKECVDTNQDGIDDNVRVVATATSGEVGFVNCVATDTIYRDSACPATGIGTAIPLTPTGTTSPFALAPLGSQELFGTIDPALLADACNTAEVTCTIAGTDLPPVTAIADPVTCNFEEREGCLTRTPGFWGTHPAVTDRYLDVQVCGTTIDNIMVGSSTSAIEALCSMGTDKKILGQQETQLIRQCTAAALNVAATLAEGGNCASDTNIATVFAACCDADSVCTGVDTGYSISECIYLVDEFNNSMDTFDPEAFNNPGPAKPTKCQNSKGNGVVVSPTPLP
jgi:hypothetical protein